MALPGVLGQFAGKTNTFLGPRLLMQIAIAFGFKGVLSCVEPLPHLQSGLHQTLPSVYTLSRVRVCASAYCAMVSGTPCTSINYYKMREPGLPAPQLHQKGFRP
jgi:hypothetical protein